MQLSDIYRVVRPEELKYWDHVIKREGYLFTNMVAICPPGIYDAVLIKQPTNMVWRSPAIFHDSDRTLEEYIDLINRLQLEKAWIIADSIEFITQCPSLKYMRIQPTDQAGDSFDVSPLYHMPQLRSVEVHTEYGENLRYTTTVDYSRIKGIEKINVVEKHTINYSHIPSLKDITLNHLKIKDLKGISDSKLLDTLYINLGSIRTLDGIEQFDKMQCVYLMMNKSLENIDALYHVRKSLKLLQIEDCAKIKDFSVLRQLENLESLELVGSNRIPSLDFIRDMKNLKSFVFSVYVEDGDLSPCMGLHYADCRTPHRHYNIKRKDLPHGKFIFGNENIDEWRRLTRF